MKMRFADVHLHHQQRQHGKRDRKKVRSCRKRKLHNKENFTFFSYGKQSLEVSCFYSRPFLFIPGPSRYYLLTRKQFMYFGNRILVKSTFKKVFYTLLSDGDHKYIG
jgi:hypothetical protein